MTRVAALELDAPPPPLDSPDAADAAPAAVRRRRALEPRVAEKVRAKLKRAVDSSRGSLGIDEFFGQVDKDGSGLLDVLELHRVLRELLRIPEYAVSDSEVSSLFVTLDADKSGSIDIREFAAFLDAPASGDVGAWASATAPVSGRTTTTGTPGPRPGTSPQVGTRSSRGSPLGAPGAPRPGTSLGAVRCAPLLSRAELERARRALQEAVQEHAPGQDAMELLGGAGAELEDEDLLRLFRRVLRVPSTALSDDDAVGLRASLDEEMTGRLSVTKLVEFIDLGD
ncbi:unnamed protein product [Prorocentrum cordatum]|uniref:EF-hand domain-containing protein n=1 Tax=Prorocentrum cordatum TaxID=2364126 RepID=A0ABN9T2J6_9DINO|nr:unnamed protein product [Polarella glacialis]